MGLRVPDLFSQLNVQVLMNILTNPIIVDRFGNTRLLLELIKAFTVDGYVELHFRP